MSESKEVAKAILIADLAGYTALTEAHGNRSAAEIVSRYLQLVEESLAPPATLVERVGDEVLIMARGADSVIRSAIQMREAIEQEPYFPTLHAGIHSGNLYEKEGRFFGSALNLTARVAVHARGGQILCTEHVMNKATGIEGVHFNPIGRVQFKNVKNPVGLYEIAAISHKNAERFLDPVCRMQVNPSEAPARLPFEGKSYYFCSFECIKAFIESPEYYCRA